jgi:hypothetical protein
MKMMDDGGCAAHELRPTRGAGRMGRDSRLHRLALDRNEDDG